MTVSIGRRELLAARGGAAAPWPLAARAQQAAVPVVGYLAAGWPETNARFVAAFRKGLSETGYVEGRNVAIEYRWAHEDYDRLPELASDLVPRGMSNDCRDRRLTDNTRGQSREREDSDYFRHGRRPVQAGFVLSLNRPGGNLTGVVTMNVELDKEVELRAHEAAEGVLAFKPNSPSRKAEDRKIEIHDAKGATQCFPEFL